MNIQQTNTKRREGRRQEEEEDKDKGEKGAKKKGLQENETVERENKKENGRQKREGEKASGQIGVGGHFRPIIVQIISGRHGIKGKAVLTAIGGQNRPFTVSSHPACKATEGRKRNCTVQYCAVL
ncbi:hypothetical protein TIFTF001_026652 [Ficus carica]|uniref:Uncharacterized protein n=1 Tax=Ficus carica TaxID=3494 RepID=A0AA88DMD5_FICCA|nr:hypothetical protein TIFTF001_026652 [Ficus carica]